MFDVFRYFPRLITQQIVRNIYVEMLKLAKIR